MHRSLPLPLRARLACACLFAALTTLAPVAVFAQSVPSPAPAPAAPPPEETIVLSTFTVAGTQIRGVEPTGTNSFNLGQVAIEKTGAAKTNDLLASIPQAGLFNLLPAGAADFGNPTVRPRLRNLGSGGSNTTLVLLNGHRMVGAGILQTTPDAGVIPPGALAEVQIVPDGGSAIYGSDAIGGVINFVTRKKFDGTLLSAHYGFADDYFSTDANLTHGFDWTGGSAVLSVSYSKNDDILGSDRDFYSADHRARGGADLRTRSAVPGNITTGGVTYDMATRQPGVNLRDSPKFSSYYPSAEQTALFGFATHDFSERLTVSVDAYWSQRSSVVVTDQGGISGVINSTNPYFQPIGAETTQNVAFSFAPVLGDYARTWGRYTSMGVAPTFTVKLGGDWELRFPLNYGHSINRNDDRRAGNAAAANAALLGTTTATALNPYNLAASNPAVIDSIRDYTFWARATQTLAEFRSVADGSIFDIAGGNVRMAVGAEYSYSDIDARRIQGRVGSNDNLATAAADRNVKSAFVEFFVPLVGRTNATTGLRSLKLSTSARYDDYSDFGSTTNPKIGLTYQPIDELTLRANYGTAFNAPSLADTSGGVDTRAQLFQTSNWRASGTPASEAGRTTILLAGGTPGLKPQEADTWSTGLDWKPTALNGLTVSVTYWNIAFTDAIATTPFTNPVLYTDPAFASFYIINPTADQLKAVIGNRVLDGFASVDALYAAGRAPYVVINAQRRNFGTVDTDGVDVQVDYRRSTRFGAIYGNVTAAKTLNRESTRFPGAATVDDLATTFTLAVSTSVGAQIGRFDGSVLWKYSEGYDVLGDPTQTKVDAFDPLDLNLAYDLDGLARWTRQMRLTLHVKNIFDQDPPYYNRDTTGINTTVGLSNGFTLGREIIFGLEKRF